MTTPSYIVRRIADSQRKAKPGNCPKCRAPILTGPSHDDVAMICQVDAEPISPRLEPACIAAGLQTFDLDRGELCYREPWHRGGLVNPFPIHVWHTCREGAR